MQCHSFKYYLSTDDLECFISRLDLFYIPDLSPHLLLVTIWMSNCHLKPTNAQDSPIDFSSLYAITLPLTPKCFLDAYAKNLSESDVSLSCSLQPKKMPDTL